MLANNTKDSLDSAYKFFDKAINHWECNNWTSALKELSSAHKIFLANKKLDYVSMCLSLTGLVKYLNKSENYYNSLLLLEDAKYLAENTEGILDNSLNRFAFGVIYLYENKINDGVLYLTNAVEGLDKLPAIKNKALNLLKSANTEDGIKRVGKVIDKKNTNLILALSNIARSVNAESTIDKLLNTIAEQTKIVLNADRCTVFLYDKETNELWSKVALGIGEEIRFSADKGLAGSVFKTGKTIRIKDAYSDKRFNPEIDKVTGYKTYNMLCMPIHNINYDIIGVFQVLNKKNGTFTDSDEDILLAIATNAGIAIENNRLLTIRQNMLTEQQKLFESLIDTLAASIDAKDSITLGHSARVRLYSELIAKELKLPQETINIISKAAMLHDIGKIGTKDAVLQKKGSLTKEEYEHIKEHVRITYDILSKTNINASFKEITEIASSHHEKFDGTGYFRSLRGENIPLGGRILAVGDVFDAITSVRHYRDRMPIKDALNIILDGRNKHFDPNIVDAFLNIKCDTITDILVMEYKTTLNSNDRKILAGINLQQFAQILNNENLSDKEQEIIKVFEKYYIRKSQGSVNV